MGSEMCIRDRIYTLSLGNRCVISRPAEKQPALPSRITPRIEESLLKLCKASERLEIRSGLIAFTGGLLRDIIPISPLVSVLIKCRDSRDVIT